MKGGPYRYGSIPLLCTCVMEINNSVLSSFGTQASQLTQGDMTVGVNRRPSSLADGGSVEIPEFLKKKGRSLYPRA